MYVCVPTYLYLQCLGDQQAALVGHGCFSPHTCKSTLVSGIFSSIVVINVINVINWTLSPPSSNYLGHFGSYSSAENLVSSAYKQYRFTYGFASLNKLARHDDQI